MGNVDTKRLEYGLGRLPSEDSRDRSFPMSALAERPVKRYRYYRTGAVLNQGSEPICVGAAWQQFIASAPIMSENSPPMRAIYHAAQRVDEWPGENYAGTSVRAGAKVLHALGHIASYHWAWNAETVADFLLSGQGTVVVGSAWTTAMFAPDDNGLIRFDGRVVGGHAYLVVGYSRPRGLFRILNSWGEQWGQGGRAWVEGETMDELIQNGGEACAAIERPLDE